MTELSLSCSKRIIDATIVEGNALGLNPLSVVVLDTGGHVKAFERQDGASPGRFAIAQAKAYGSVMLGISEPPKWLGLKHNLIFPLLQMLH